MFPSTRVAPIGAALSLMFLFAATASAQQQRLPRRIDSSRRTVLANHRNPRARQEYDAGPLDRGRRITGLTLHFKPDAGQTAALEQLLREQQDPSSPNYHNWLTPDEFANRFGLAPADFDSVAAWLRGQGFRIDYAARSRTWICFSGEAGQVEDAFRTELRRYRVNGREHFANAAAPSLPADLAAVVQFIGGLDDFRMRSRMVTRPLPRYTSNSGVHAVGPGDLATIYNAAPLFAKGINGTGQTIVVVGQTAVTMSDIESFRKRFGLPVNDPNLVLVPGLPDPGISDDDLGEALLDLEYAGGMAPYASIQYVYSPNVELSLYYAIDQNLAPVISMSYGLCEAMVTAGSSSAASERLKAQQANAQGITWVAASGDAGAADCEPQGVATAGVHGATVDMPASIPEVTGVGGTEFNEGGRTYWNSSNGPNGDSAQSYIPEMVWNDTAADGVLLGGGGGASVFFPKPAWQIGLNVPNDSARDVPDVALTASADHDPYAVVQDGNLIGTGGTSAAAPTFAGILALVNQYLADNHLQSKPGLGNINPNLYLLAGTAPSVFHDVTAGSNIVPCTTGSPGCTSGQYGFNAGPGYDQGSGLGSVDAFTLATSWKGATNTPATVSTTTSISANPPSITINGSSILTATVRAASGTTSPTGSVSFNAGKTALGSANLSGSGGSATASITVYGSQLAIGTNSISVSYGGTTTFLASTGTGSLTVTVPTATTASAVVPSIVPNPIYEQAPDQDGFAWFYTVRLTEIAGTETRLTGFSIAGTDHSGDMQSWFGSTTLPAHGTLSANIRSRGLTVPANREFVFTGVDSSGQPWSQQLSIPFLPQQISASMTLSSSPGTEVQNRSGDPECDSDHPFYQQLNLQEKNGYEVILNKFLAGGNELSDGIADWFGSVRLAPLGSLHADICWSIDKLPSTLTYELDGTDTAGHKITSTLSVPFQGPGQSPGTLATSKNSVALAAGSSQSATTTLNVSLPSTEQWTVSLFPDNQKTSWLVVFPQSGAGSGQVTLVASAAGMGPGAYTAELVFQSVNTIPQFVNVPVTFTVGSTGAATISGLTNGASFERVYAPGMILTVFGAGLANSTKAASTVPLPMSLDGVSVTVNGIPAPLYFISPGQLNVQVPYETAAGTATLGVNNNTQIATKSFEVDLTAPGIFTGGNGAIVPISSAKRGDSILMYITGEGDTTPALDTGAPPATSLPVSQLPTPRQSLSMTVAGIPVTPFFVGIPYGLVGVTQINFAVPANAPTGMQPVTVTVGESASKTAALNITAGGSTAAAVRTAAAFLPEAVAPPLEIPATRVKAAPVRWVGGEEDAAQVRR